MKPEAGSLKKINNIDKPLAWLIERASARASEQMRKKWVLWHKETKSQMKENNTTMEIRTIVRQYYEKLYINKLDNLEEMDKFLETYNLLKPKQEEIENLDKPVTSNEAESVIKNSQQANVQDQTASQDNSTKHLNS